MVLLELDPCLNELTKLYEQTKKSGTVWVTFKRSTLQRQKERKTVDENTHSAHAKDHLRFQTSYGTVLKVHMDSLKKKEEKDKREKRTTATKAPVS